MKKSKKLYVFQVSYETLWREEVPKATNRKPIRAKITDWIGDRKNVLIDGDAQKASDALRKRILGQHADEFVCFKFRLTGVKLICAVDEWKK